MGLQPKGCALEADIDVLSGLRDEGVRGGGYLNSTNDHLLGYVREPSSLQGGILDPDAGGGEPLGGRDGSTGPFRVQKGDGVDSLRVNRATVEVQEGRVEPMIFVEARL